VVSPAKDFRFGGAARLRVQAQVSNVTNHPNYDAALAIARECPGNNVIEIRELGGYA
jgi:hypothetical protein